MERERTRSNLISRVEKNGDKELNANLISRVEKKGGQSDECQSS